MEITAKRKWMEKEAPFIGLIEIILMSYALIVAILGEPLSTTLFVALATESY